MSGVNRVILLGNLGANPEIRTLEGGIMVANFPLATSELFRDKNTGEKKEQTEWHNIVLWRNVAQSAEKAELRKGDRIYLEGKIKTRKWVDREQKERFTIEIVAEKFNIINRKKVESTETES